MGGSVVAGMAGAECQLWKSWKSEIVAMKTVPSVASGCLAAQPPADSPPPRPRQKKSGSVFPNPRMASISAGQREGKRFDDRLEEAMAAIAGPNPRATARFIDRTRAIADRIADGVIADSVAGADQQETPPSKRPEDIESNSQNQLDSMSVRTGGRRRGKTLVGNFRIDYESENQFHSGVPRCVFFARGCFALLPCWSWFRSGPPAGGAGAARPRPPPTRSPWARSTP